METLTLENRIQILGETKGLPVGQRCRKLQYPLVTVEQLAERFAVHKLAAAYNRAETMRILKLLAEHHGITEEAATARFRVDLKNSDFQDTVEEARRDAMRSASAMGQWDIDFIRYEMQLSRMNRLQGPANFQAKFCTGKVHLQALDHYMGDEIPERVIDSLEVARESGLAEFYVAYPVIETKDVTVTEKQERDPVLLALLGDKYLEIDMWE